MNGRSDFSLIRYYVEIMSLPVIFLFILSLGFLFYAFSNTFFLGFTKLIFILVILGILLFLMDFAYKKNKMVFLRRSLLLGLLLGLTLTLFFSYVFFGDPLYIFGIFGFGSVIINVFIITALVVFTVVNYFVYYVKLRNNPESAELIFLTIAMSLIFAFAITLLAYLIFAFGIFSFFNNISPFISILFINLMIFLFILSHLYISKSLFKKWSLDQIVPSPIKTASLLFIILLLISMVVVTFSGIRFVKSSYNQISNEEQQFADAIQIIGLERYNKIIRLKGYDGDIITTVIAQQNNQFIYSKESLANTTTIFYDCDVNLNCQTKQFNPYERLETQVVNLKNNKMMAIAKKNSKKDVYILPRETVSEIISHNIFEFENPELRNTKIASEIDEQHSTILGKISKKTKQPESLQEEIYAFYSNNVYDDVYNLILLKIEYGLKRGSIQNSQRIVTDEFNWINANKINKTLFYDGTTNATEHIQRLQNSTDQLQILLSNENLFNSKVYCEDKYALFTSFAVDESPVIKATAILFHSTDFYNVKTNVKACERRYSTQFFEGFDKNFNYIQENEISRLLRLKIMEIKMIRVRTFEIISSSDDFDEMNENIDRIINLTKDPKECYSFLYYRWGYDLELQPKVDECIMKYSKYNKKACEEIKNITLRNQCLQP